MKIPSEIISTINEAKEHVEFLPTGFTKIDNFLDGGFLKKELIVLGGAAGRGKSYLSGHIFNHIARQGFKSAYFSLEISSEMVVSRILGEQVQASPTKIMTGLPLLQKQHEALSEAKAEIVAYDELMFFYDDVYAIKEIENQVKDNGYDFVVVDFIQNVVSLGDEYERLSKIAITLQKLAKQANCAILVLSQLSNSMVREKRDDIVEYRGSGTIATVCDLGFFMETELTEQEFVNKLSIKLRKNRRGQSGISFDYIFKNGQIIDI